jgi:DNA gyrase subunit A
MAKKAAEEKAPDESRVGGVMPMNIAEEMRVSYLDYAMSVIVSRALPDVRDGLKPVHRRILYSMHENGLTASSRFKKSATVVGDVLGKYHPHGDASVYDAMVKLAQDFSMRYPLISGQGNFGSIDGDSAAAMRYTEAKMSRVAGELLRDLEKDTVDFRPNYDGSRKEPDVLPSLVPNLLLNGTLGIAVGMATSIPPHNLGEVMDATAHLIEDPDATTEDLLQYVQGPDFPTGAVIYNKKEIEHAYATGRGGVTCRGEAEISEEKAGHGVIVITSLPYRVNKADLIAKIADLVREKKLEGLKGIRDESAKGDIRIVIDLKTGVPGQKVLNYLYKHTELESVFHFNMVALVDQVPQTLSLKSILSEFIGHRKTVTRRRTEFDLGKAKDREHILLGLKKALDHIDEIIKVIKASKDTPTAHANLMAKFKFSDRQATAILEMKLQKLAGLERKKIEDELHAIQELIKELESILKSEKKLVEVVKKELKEVRGRALFWPFVWIMVLRALAVVGGLAIFLLPGIWLSIAFTFAPIILLDSGLRGTQALAASHELVKGRWWQTFGRTLVSGFLVGFLAALITMLLVVLIGLFVGFDKAFALAAAGQTMGGMQVSMAEGLQGVLSGIVQAIFLPLAVIYQVKIYHSLKKTR